MPKTNFTRERWNNHFQYGKIMYVVIALIAFMCADLLYTVTQYHAPNERKVDIEVVVSYVDPAGFDTIAANALEAGQAFDDTLEEVNVYNVAYDPESTDDVYGAQKYMVMLAAQEGDIYMLPYSLMEQLANDGSLVPLDDYIAQGVIDPGDQDLGSVTFYEPTEDGTTSDVQHVYALSCESLYGMMDSSINIDNRDLYACIMSYSKNQDTTAVVLESFFDQLTAPKPDWVKESEEASSAEETAESTPEPAAEADGQ